MKYKIGDKVILKSKHGEQIHLENSVVYKRLKSMNQEFAYITGIFNNTYYRIHDNQLAQTGDYYEEDDVDGYLKIERRIKLEKINEKRG